MEHSKYVEEVCPRCGGTLICTKNSNCFCMNIELSEETKDYISKKYDTCLCEICLLELECENKLK